MGTAWLKGPCNFLECQDGVEDMFKPILADVQSDKFDCKTQRLKVFVAETMDYFAWITALKVLRGDILRCFVGQTDTRSASARR